MPDPIPFGLTRLLAIVRAIVRASLLNSPGGGAVETVVTSCDHFRFAAMFVTHTMLAAPGGPKKYCPIDPDSTATIH
ncbi:MAG TPA: hypothetical protein VGM03_04395 [Phycisphaerae bacterium]